MNVLGRGAAALVPALLLAGCGDATSSLSTVGDPTTSSGPTATTPPSGSPTPTPTATSVEPTGPAVLSTIGLAEGPTPRVPYLARDPGTDDWSLVGPDGAKRRLGRPYDAFASLGDDLVATATPDDATMAFVLDGDLQEISRAPDPGGALTVSADGWIVGWLGSDARPRGVEREGMEEWTLPAVEDAGSVAAIISDGGTCLFDCAVFVNSHDGTRAWAVGSSGSVRPVPGVISVGDVTTDGRMIAMTSVDDEGSCWGLFEVWKAKPIWETCDYTLFDFSPTGDRILAGPAYLDGFGQGFAAVLDEDGNVLAEWRSRGQAAILHTIWEDDDHVLAIVFQDESWAVLRLGVDGSVEIAVPPVPDETGQGAFVLPTR